MARALAERLPVPVALRLYRALAPLARVPPSLSDLGAHGLGLRGPALARWQRRAWWGSAASRTVKDRVARGDTAWLEEMLLPVDWTPLEAARALGRGVVVAGAHIGPGGVASWVLARRHPELFSVMAVPHHTVPGMRVADVNGAQDRATALAAARLVLRGGGLVYIPADGLEGALWTERPLLGRTLGVREGAPLLARLCRAPTVPMCALWSGDHIKVELAPAILPTAEDPEAWGRAWLDGYAGWLEGLLRGPAENLQLDGGGFA